MGKRSNFERVERDFYPTPPEAVKPLVPHLPSDIWFYEPCAGDGALINHIEELGENRSCVAKRDIEPRVAGIYKGDALDITEESVEEADFIITNPPWSRHILHPMIEHFRQLRPTWLLFDADWMHTKQASPYLPYCHKIVSVGRVKWIPDSKHTGKDNCCWYLFDKEEKITEFYGR